MLIRFLIMRAYTEKEPLSCNFFRHFSSELNPFSNPKSILRNSKLNSIPSLLLWEHGTSTFSYVTLLLKPYSPHSDNCTCLCCLIFPNLPKPLAFQSFPGLPRLPSLILLITQIAPASFLVSLIDAFLQHTKAK